MAYQDATIGRSFTHFMLANFPKVVDRTYGSRSAGGLDPQQILVLRAHYDGREIDPKQQRALQMAVRQVGDFGMQTREEPRTKRGRMGETLDRMIERKLFNFWYENSIFRDDPELTHINRSEKLELVSDPIFETAISCGQADFTQLLPRMLGYLYQGPVYMTDLASGEQSSDLVMDGVDVVDYELLGRVVRNNFDTPGARFPYQLSMSIEDLLHKP